MEFLKDIHYSIEFEKAVLGAYLLEKEAFSRTLGIITTDNFYNTFHQQVFDAIDEMYRQHIPIDLLTVYDFILNRKQITELDGYNPAYFLTKLTNDVTSTVNLEYHAFVLKRMWMERELLKLTNGGFKSDSDNVKDKIFELQSNIHKINSSEYKSSWVDMSELMYQLSQHQDEMTKTKGMGVTTGINVLDTENGGFFGGQMIIIGARPSVGKSAFMGQMAMAMAKKGTTVGIISLEMNNNEIAARLTSIETQEDFKTIYRNLYRDEEHRANWYNKISTFASTPIFVSDATDVNAIDIKSKAHKLKYSNNLGCLMVDYLQLVNSEGQNRNRTRENEVSNISRSMKLMAKELNIPVIVLCQLNRAITHRASTQRFPQLSDLRESGSLEQDADIVMFIHRDWMLGEGFMADEQGNSTENKADLIIRKWRNGASNLHIPMEFDAPKMLFRQINQFEQWNPETVNYNDQNPF